LPKKAAVTSNCFELKDGSSIFLLDVSKFKPEYRVTIRETVLFLITAVRTSDPTFSTVIVTDHIFSICVFVSQRKTKTNTATDNNKLTNLPIFKSLSFQFAGR
jgi:hypothetical protein